jgi:hypothetical protein
MKLSKYETTKGKCMECPHRVDQFTCGMPSNCDAEIYLDPKATYIIKDGKVKEVATGYSIEIWRDDQLAFAMVESLPEVK